MTNLSYKISALCVTWNQLVANLRERFKGRDIVAEVDADQDEIRIHVFQAIRDQLTIEECT